MSVLGIDLGGTRMKIGVVNGREVDALVITESTAESGLARCLPIIREHVRSLVEMSQMDSITGIGMAFPGLVNTVKNKVISTSAKYDDATGIDLVKWAWESFGLPLKLENDARMACLGEWKFGAGQNTSDMVMCTLGTGIGTSAIIDNQILRGKHFQAGVLGGHFVIDYKNTKQRCSCGKYGCLEAIASTKTIGRLKTKSAAFAKSSLFGYEKLDLAIIFDHSAQGDELACSLRDHCLDAWSVGLVNLIHAYDPEVVVVGGGIMHSKDFIIPYLKKTVAKKAWCPGGIPEILPAGYPDTAALLGAGVLFETEKKDELLKRATA